jgi:hypothetical protein
VKGEQCHGISLVGRFQVVERVAQLDPCAELTGMARAEESVGLLCGATVSSSP